MSIKTLRIQHTVRGSGGAMILEVHLNQNSVKVADRWHLRPVHPYPKDTISVGESIREFPFIWNQAKVHPHGNSCGLLRRAAVHGDFQ